MEINYRLGLIEESKKYANTWVITINLQIGIKILIKFSIKIIEMALKNYKKIRKKK